MMDTHIERFAGRGIALALVAFSLFACGGKEEVEQEALDRTAVPASVVQKGQGLFTRHCARCHGDNAQGDVNWRAPGADGRYPPPPLDGSGHAWHHPMPLLRDIILKGTEPAGNMPGWEEKLSREDVDAIIYWFQSLWPEDVYTAWRDNSKRMKM